MNPPSDDHAVHTSSIQYLHSTGPLPLGLHFNCSAPILLPDYPPSQRIMPVNKRSQATSTTLPIAVDSHYHIPPSCTRSTPHTYSAHPAAAAFPRHDPLARESRIAVAVQLAAVSALAVELNPASAVRPK